MQIVILKAGLLSTIQDQGRTGYRNIGIPVSGAMDSLALQIANLLVGNDRNCPVIELTYGDVEVISETAILVAYCGGGSVLSADGQSLPDARTLFIPAGTHLRFDSHNKGCRTYFAIAGGWDAQHVLNSCSTYLPVEIGGLEGRALQAGNRLKNNQDLSATTQAMLTQLRSSSINYPQWGVLMNRFADYSSKRVRTIINHEFDWFDSDSQEAFFTNTFSVSMQSNRMGYQLSGTALIQKTTEQLLSTAVSKGTIQVTQSGLPILLMADCQTTGGYPRIAQVAAVDLPICAQLKPGDSIAFDRIELAEAERAFVKQAKQLSELEKVIEGRYR